VARRAERPELVDLPTTPPARRGTARAVVVATAKDTEFGRIYRLTAQIRTKHSPMRRQVAGMARKVAVGAFCLGALQAVWAPDQTHAVSGAGCELVGVVENPESLRRTLQAAVLCCDARLLPADSDGGWRVLGDTTEGALLVVAAKAGLDVSAEQRAAPRTEEFPFDANRKLMTTVHRVDDTVIAYVKGAPQELLARCTHIVQGAEGVFAISDAMRARVATVNDDKSREALRVVGVASN
jgi:magnesium-transporting ATPase (P-type)